MHVKHGGMSLWGLEFCAAHFTENRIVCSIIVFAWICFILMWSGILCFTCSMLSCPPEGSKFQNVMLSHCIHVYFRWWGVGPGLVAVNCSHDRSPLKRHVEHENHLNAIWILALIEQMLGGITLSAATTPLILAISWKIIDGWFQWLQLFVFALCWFKMNVLKLSHTSCL